MYNQGSLVTAPRKLKDYWIWGASAPVHVGGVVWIFGAGSLA